MCDECGREEASEIVGPREVCRSCFEALCEEDGQFLSDAIRRYL